MFTSRYSRDIKFTNIFLSMLSWTHFPSAASHPLCVRCLWCRPVASVKVRLLDCGTKVCVSVLSCMILLSVSQFNREAFGEWQWGCRGGGGDALTHTQLHIHTSALIHTDLCGLSTMPVFVFDRKIDSLAGREQPRWRIKTRKVLVAVNHFSVH